MAAEIYSSWRGAGIVAAVRVNPLETEGRADLAAVMRGRPDVVIMSKVAEPAQVAALDEEVMRLERHFDIPPGTTELAPNVESARGIMQTYAIAKASRRVTAVLGSTEDVTADLGAPRRIRGASPKPREELVERGRGTHRWLTCGAPR